MKPIKIIFVLLKTNYPPTLKLEFSGGLELNMETKLLLLLYSCLDIGYLKEFDIRKSVETSAHPTLSMFFQ